MYIVLLHFYTAVLWLQGDLYLLLWNSNSYLTTNSTLWYILQEEWNKPLLLIINSNDSRQSVCFYINYVYSTFLHMYTQYIYPSSHIHDTDRPNKRICKTTPYLKKYASFSNTQELHLLYLNHIWKLLFTGNLVLPVKQWRIVDCIVERNWLQCLPKYQLHQENVLKMTVF